MEAPLAFEIKSRASGSRARLGVIHTAHGEIETPGFMPVATQATVKGLDSSDLLRLDVQLLIANTYHLSLRPGAEQVAEQGGLHKFMNWPRAISTDSGGFQVFSLGAAIRDGVGKIADIFPDEARASFRGTPAATRTPLVKIDDEGVTFNSHLDGSLLRLTPERSMEIQHLLGADFMLAFDECTSPLDPYEYTRSALGRTHQWAVRCLEQHSKTRRVYQSLFGIVQGGAFRDLREDSAAFLSTLPFDGIAIGGSLGRSKADMHTILEWTIPILQENKPRHLLGIGELADIVECVERGIDLFDCAAPSRWARNGSFLISLDQAREEGLEQGRLVIGNARYASDSRPIDARCSCPTCESYSRAYLHHLHRARELSYFRLATLHNLHFMMTFMSRVRGAIAAGEWERFRANPN